MKLSDTKLRNFKPEEKTYRKSDGEGLFIEVRPNGSKLWRLAYRLDGKQKLLAIGKYPEVSLSKAREKKVDAKSLIADGVDPVKARQKERAKRLEKTEHTFEKIAAELLDKRAREGLAEVTLKKRKWLIGIANVDLGKLPITEIDARTVLRALQKVEAEGNFEKAKRLRAAISEVFRYAVATARVGIDPTAALRGALTSPKVKHLPAVTKHDEFGHLIRAVWDYEGSSPSTRAGLKLLALLYPRPSELRLSNWNEFDLENREWRIPASRTKTKRPHKKPLSEMAVSILKELKLQTNGGDLVLQSSISRSRPISENTMNQALRRMGFAQNEHCSHGFRSSASSLLNECGLWNPDAIEAELDHTDRNRVRQVYNRTRYWDERVKMADWWSNEISSMLKS